MAQATNPKLSVITVCYNEGGAIEQTLKSVAQQTWTDLEYIVIDGASTDGTLDIINKYRDNIDMIISEPDNGIYDAMNKGIGRARGDYISFVNGGDYYTDSKVLTRAFSAADGSDIVYGDIIVQLTGGTKIRKKNPNRPGRLFMSFDTIPHLGTLIKRELLVNAGLYNCDYKIAADYEFFINAIFNMNCSLKYIPVAFTVFNSLGVSSSGEGKKRGIEEMKQVQRKYFDSAYMKTIGIKGLFYKYLVKYPSYFLFLVAGTLWPGFLKNND